MVLLSFSTFPYNLIEPLHRGCTYCYPLTNSTHLLLFRIDIPILILNIHYCILKNEINVQMTCPMTRRLMDHYATHTEVACFSLLQKKFINYLLKGTKKLSPQFAMANNETISHIINCSTGIFLLSLKKCDLEINPNPPVGSNECARKTAKNIQ